MASLMEPQPRKTVRRVDGVAVASAVMSAIEPRGSAWPRAVSASAAGGSNSQLLFRFLRGISQLRPLMSIRPHQGASDEGPDLLVRSGRRRTAVDSPNRPQRSPAPPFKPRNSLHPALQPAGLL